ncbi:MAG: cysteine methyltransferase [Acidobacteria bacterium]|nr:MAG: cysteine methyltransferase [Acidobacteriota bacterium]
MERPHESFSAHSIDKNRSVAKRDNPNYRERVYKIVRSIPSGRVMTYGQIAELLGDGYTPRTVGFVMHATPEGTPWHRVLNAQGACSTGNVVLPHDKQQRLLEREGVVFDKNGRCDLQTFLWKPKSRSKRLPTVTLFKRTSAKSSRGVKR